MSTKLPTHPRCLDVPTCCCAKVRGILHVFRMILPMWTPVLGMEGSKRYLYTHVKLGKRPLEVTWGRNSVQITACLPQGLEERYTFNS